MQGWTQGRRTGIAAALVALGIAAAGCAGLGGPRADAQRACWPRFPYRQGWLGGDGAYSVPLSPTRSVWLFGDTFIGRPGQRDRVGGALVHNSVGISECRDGRFTIEYAWGTGADRTPRAFLERPGGGWWWLFGGFVHQGALYVGLLEVERAPPRGPLGIPFRHTGSSLARIANPGDPPARWRTEVLPLTRGSLAQPLSAFAVAGAHLYLFGFSDLPDGRHPRILARLPLAALAAPAAALETWTRDARWTPGWRPGEAAIVMDDDASEMSVRHHPESGRWVALYSYPDVAGAFPGARPSDAVWARSAPAPEGPWSPRRLVFRVPELAPDPAGAGDPHLGCYAAKEQAQFSRPGSLTFTYVCNLFSGPTAEPFAVLGRLQRRMDLYRPIAATVTCPWPPSGGHDGAGALDPAGPRH